MTPRPRRRPRRADRGPRLHGPALMGHSMGAVTVLALAGLYPDIPAAVVLEDPPPSGCRRPACSRREPRDRHARGWRACAARPASSSSPKSAAKPNLARGGACTVGRCEGRACAQPGAPRDPAAQQPDWPAIMSRITCPVLAIAADGEKGAALSEEGITSLQAAVPHVQVVRGGRRAQHPSRAARRAHGRSDRVLRGGAGGRLIPFGGARPSRTNECAGASRIRDRAASRQGYLCILCRAPQRHSP